MNRTDVQRNFKDTVFRMIFNEKKNLLSLYNALNQTSYTDMDDLEITTLETRSRDLFYVSRVLHNRIKDENLYSKKLIKIPASQFVVFYNGTDGFGL